jgi:hypothetical protein
MAWETAVGQVNSPYSIDIPNSIPLFSSFPPSLVFTPLQKCVDLRIKREILNFPIFLALTLSAVIGQWVIAEKVWSVL